MISAFGVEHGEISKLSGYDYEKDGQRVVATRVGWTESDKPSKEMLGAAKWNAKKAGKLRLTKPHTWKKSSRARMSTAAHERTLGSFRASAGPSKGKYTEQVWEHKNLSTGKKHHQTGNFREKPYKGTYRTWDRKDRTKYATAEAR